MGFATAQIDGKGPLSPVHSWCSKTQLKAAHHALRPKITLQVSHPECNAYSSSRRVPFCGKWPPQTFSYFWRNGKIFHWAIRREHCRRNCFFSQPFWILWSWQSPQCGFDRNGVSHLSKHLHKSLIYLFSLIKCPGCFKCFCCVLWTHSSWYDRESGWLLFTTKSQNFPRNVHSITIMQCDCLLVSVN